MAKFLGLSTFTLNVPLQNAKVLLEGGLFMFPVFKIINSITCLTSRIYAKRTTITENSQGGRQARGWNRHVDEYARARTDSKVPQNFADFWEEQEET